MAFKASVVSAWFIFISSPSAWSDVMLPPALAVSTHLRNSAYLSLIPWYLRSSSDKALSVICFDILLYSLAYFFLAAMRSSLAFASKLAIWVVKTCSLSFVSFPPEASFSSSRALDMACFRCSVWKSISASSLFKPSFIISRRDCSRARSFARISSASFFWASETDFTVLSDVLNCFILASYSTIWASSFFHSAVPLSDISIASIAPWASFFRFSQ